MDKFMKWSEDVDEAVMKSEPGMLYHVGCAVPGEENCIMWVEMYQNDEAAKAHITSPIVAEWMPKMAEFADPDKKIVAQLMGEFTGDTQKIFEAFPNTELTICPRIVGGSGVFGPRGPTSGTK